MTINGIAVGAGTLPTTGANTGNLTVSSPITNLTGTITVQISLSGASGTGTIRLDDFTLVGSVLQGPTLSASTLTAFGPVCISTTSASNLFTITGTNLTATNITVGPFAGYSFSTNNATFSPSLSFSLPGNQSQNIYVRFSPVLVQAYIGYISITGGGATPISVYASGNGVNTTPTVSNGTVSGLTSSGATISAVISSNGCTGITGYGIEYSTAPGFANGNGTQVSSSNLLGGNYSVTLSSLVPPGQTFYFHTYATNGGGTSYGIEGSFTLLNTIPTLTVPSAGAGSLAGYGNVCINTADTKSFSLSGSLLNGSPVTVGPLTGYSFATSLNGTYSNTLALTTAGTDYSYSAGILSGCTIYVKFIPTLVQSYNGTIPVNGGGATSISVNAIGEGVNTAPSVTTDAAILITTNSATLPATVVSEGCGFLLNYGFEYSTAVFTPGTGIVVPSTNIAGTDFSSDLTSLLPNTTYYYCAYVENSGGKTYGAISSFTTFAIPTKLVIISVSPASPTALTPFSITVQAQDNFGNPVDVPVETDIQLNQAAGTGVFTFPNAPLEAGTIFEGTSTVTISNISYSIVENGVALTATAMNGLTALGTSLPFSFNVIAYTGPTSFTWSAAGNTAWLTGTNWQAGTAPGSTTIPATNNHLAQFTSLANLLTSGVGGCGINMSSAGTVLNVGAIYFSEGYNFNHVGDVVPIGNSSTSTSGSLYLYGAPLNNVGGISGNNYSNLLLANYMTGSTTKTLEIRNASPGGSKFMTLNISNAGSIVSGPGRTIGLSTYMTGNQAITMTGGGSFILNPSGVSTVNDFSGAINISNGTLLLGNSGAFSTSSPNIITLGSLTNAGILRLNGNSVTIGGLSTSGTAGNSNIVDNGNASASLTVQMSANYTFGGSIRNGSLGTLSLVKSGTGVLTLSGLNQYTGTTTINAGTLRLNNPGGLTIPSANSITLNAGILRISTDQTLNTLNITSGTLQVDAGVTLTITGSYNPGPGSVSIINNGTIRLQCNAPQSFPGLSTTVTSMNNLTINSIFGVSMNKNLNIAGVLTLTNGSFTVGAFTLTLNNPIAGTAINLSADQTSSIVIAGTAANVNLPSSVSQLNNFTVSNSSGTTLQGNLNVKTTVVITATSGTVFTGLHTFNGNANLTMNGGNLYMEKNGVVLPEFNGVYTLNAGTVTFAGVGIASDAQTVRPINYFNLVSDVDGDRILSSAGTIGVANNFVPYTSPYNNAYTITGSTIDFFRVGSQNLPAFTYFNIRLSGGASVTKNLAGHIEVVNSLSIATATRLVLGAFNVTMKSSASNTARVDAIPTVNSIIYGGAGRFIVERYLATGTGPSQHGKGWQLLASPTIGQTIKQSWQEGAASVASNPLPGFGIQITSDLANATSLGFDIATTPGSGPGMKTYDPATNTWVGVPNTNAQLISNKKGYMVFVRGDRSVTTSAQAATPVILRTTGRIYSPGADAPAGTTVAAGKFESIGNPYASAIHFTNLLSTSTGIDSKFYVWDPLLYGTYGYGGFQTISSVNGYQPVPGGTINYPTGVPVTSIQSGQAFFVYSTPGGTVNFAESNKMTGGASVFRQGGPDDRVSISTSLYAASGNLVDGNLLLVDPAFSNAVDANDAKKFSGFSEGIGIVSLDQQLSVETRRDILDKDTINYHVQSLRTQSYQLRIAFNQFESLALEPILADRFTGVKQSLRLSDTNRISFTVTTDPASRAADRFYLVFKNLRPVPVGRIDISAQRLTQQSASVQWVSSREESIAWYQVEKSSGTGWTRVGTINPAHNQGSSARYNWKDDHAGEGLVLYRVRATGQDGREELSSIARILPFAEMEVLTVYPNPVQNKQVYIHYNKTVEPGSWAVRLLSVSGQTTWNGTFSVTAGGGGTIILRLPENIPSGTYTLQLEASGDGKYSEVIVIQ